MLWKKIDTVRDGEKNAQELKLRDIRFMDDVITVLSHYFTTITLR